MHRITNLLVPIILSLCILVLAAVEYKDRQQARKAEAWAEQVTRCLESQGEFDKRVSNILQLHMELEHTGVNHNASGQKDPGRE